MAIDPIVRKLLPLPQMRVGKHFRLIETIGKKVMSSTDDTMVTGLRNQYYNAKIVKSYGEGLWDIQYESRTVTLECPSHVDAVTVSRFYDKTSAQVYVASNYVTVKYNTNGHSTISEITIEQII